jgi:hypothetical protein
MLTTNPSGAAEAEGKPFLVEHLHLNETPVGFTPVARLIVTPTLRTSGLLRALTDEAARSLLLLLTFLTPNGHIQPTVSEIADVLGVSERKARERLHRLVAVRWYGEPVAIELPRETGMDAFALSPSILTHVEPPQEDGDVVTLPIPPASSREEVIAHSRAAYGTPRAEAERLVAEQLGIPPGEMEDTPEGEARRQMYAYGVPRDVIERLITNYPLDRIRRQIEWLPQRNAKSPGRFLIAAIENAYVAPGQRGQDRISVLETAIWESRPDGPEM